MQTFQKKEVRCMREDLIDFMYMQIGKKISRRRITIIQWIKLITISILVKLI